LTPTPKLGILASEREKVIKLYRPRDCPGCADIEAALQELVVAHQVITVEEDKLRDELSPEVTLPALKDNGQIISGPAAISAYLKELEKFVADWRRFQSDSCYIDDDGQTC
jgi:glutaredoxin